MSSQKSIRIKVCGVTTVEDAHLVAEVGADYIGVIIEVDSSPRRLSVEQARPICEQSTLPVVALFFNWEAKQIQRALATLQPCAVQLLGQESPSLIKTLKRMTTSELWKTVHLPARGLGEVNIAEYQDRINSLVEAGIDAIVIDTVVSSPQGELRYGGTGQVSNWAAAQKLVEAVSVRFFLAGGITPENVQQAIELVHPHGIDLSSGVEIAPGHKDAEKLRRLVSAARRAASEGSIR